MVLGTGIDIVEVDRVRRELSCSRWSAADGIFRPREVQYCYTGGRPEKRFAALFAAKEAAGKALGIGAPDLSAFRDIEIAADCNGAFRVRLHGSARRRYESLGAPRVLSAWHANRYFATAMVVLED